MDLLSSTIRKRETYSVHIKSSLLWECALGIAAVTNSKLIDTLEKPVECWVQRRNQFSKELINHLDYVEQHNTWKSLLLLLHQQDFDNLSDFTNFIKQLDEQKIRYYCLPFIGISHQDERCKASNGDFAAIQALKLQTKDNPFFPDYIEFICTIDPQQLKTHLVDVMNGWFKEFIEPEAEMINRYLERDKETKLNMMTKMNPEAFVEWATGGVTYLPEPSVHRVLLIPQYIYRPWTIEADVEDTKVFYYPISNASIHPEDRYAPNYFLVHKHKALGDEVRLRMVKRLSESDLTLQDLTNELGMGKTTVHHHLKLLRSARLVEAQNGKYRLKRQAVLSLAKELEQYLTEQ